ncbi:hypothetical protein [Arthrobacter sp. yr096]|uniref:hypothetical protein n=1 Tax=Arthrobacter sp. yr096 TaxID=1761750 RepID=UPI00210C27C2|nr:hypothetical protein [Arthrobacter sp. yr096]
MLFVESTNYSTVWEPEPTRVPRRSVVVDGRFGGDTRRSCPKGDGQCRRCYVAHDHGTYAGVSPIPGLIPALAVRAVVLSTPEPGLAVVGAGKRDLPYDAGYTVLLAASGVDGQAKPEARGVVRKLYDHHTVLEKTSGLDVGDVAQLGISHPCSAFERWSSYLVTDMERRVVDVWQSSFNRSTISG